MSLFRHSVWFSFSVKQFPSAEFGICNISLRIDDKNQTAEGMSEKKASAIDLFYGKSIQSSLTEEASVTPYA